MSPTCDMQNALLVSRAQQAAQEEGVRGEALRWESGRVKLNFKIFT